MKTMTIITLRTIIIVIGWLWIVRQIIGWRTRVIGITMIADVEIKKTKNRKRNGIWFNTHPFCKLSTINRGKYFQKLIDKHFNGNNPEKKMFNRKTIKIIYSCINNLYKIISNHDKNLIEKSWVDRQGLSKPLCNCSVKGESPDGGKCNSKNLVYKATFFPMENRKDIEIYFGISAGNWKQKLYNHRHSFSNPSLRNQTALSK